MSARTLLWAGVTLLLAACGSSDGGPPNPAPLPGSPPEVPPPLATGAGGGGPSGPVKRTVEVRSPLPGPAGNLLVDGDFELSSLPEGYFAQTGWSAYRGVQEAQLRAESGGLCRTGLRCARVDGSMFLFGRGAAANGVPMSASVWAKVPEGRECGVVTPRTIDCRLVAGSGVDLAAEAPAPGPDGWCVYRAHLQATDLPLCMAISVAVDATEVVLIDTAVVVPDDGVAPRSASRALPPAERAQLEAIARSRRDRTPIGAPKRPVPPIW